MSRGRQRVWAAIIISLILGGVALAYVLRDTEVVKPDVVQRDWVESKEKRPRPAQ